MGSKTALKVSGQAALSYGMLHAGSRGADGKISVRLWCDYGWSERLWDCRGGCTVGVQGARWARVVIVHGPVGSWGAVAMANAIHGA